MTTARVNPLFSSPYAVVGILLALTPALMALLPWDFGPVYGPYRTFMKGYDVTVTAVEVCIILIYLVRGNSMVGQVRRLPFSTLALFGLLSVWTLASAVIIAPYKVRAIIGLPIYLTHVLFALAIADMARQTSDQSRRRFAMLVAAGVPLYWMVWILSFQIFLPSGEQWLTEIPGVTNVRWQGYFAICGYFAAMAALPAAARNFSAQTIVATLLGSVALLLPFFTGSRGAVVAIAFGYVIAFGLARGRRSALLQFGIVTAILAVAVTLLLPLPYPGYGLFRFAATLRGEDADPSSGRLLLWALTFDKVLEHPVIGWGLNQFKAFGPEPFRGINHPHNVPLQMLFSFGIVGSTLVLAFLSSLLCQLRLALPDAKQAASAGVVAALLLSALYDGSLYYNYPLMMLIVGLAALIAPPAADRSD